MSVNTAHANNGVLIHSGESIILYSDNVAMDFAGQDGSLFKGTKTGKMYLTTHRMIFNSKSSSDPMLSFSFPFVCLTDVELEQPVFGANYIKGKVRAQENGHFTGEAKFKLLFKSGGAIDFAQAALKAAYIAKKFSNNAQPPPYTPPTGAWYEAPPPAYTASPTGYYGWRPNTDAFPNAPPPNTVFMSDNPPPYPGIVGGQSASNGFAGGPPGYPGGFNDAPGIWSTNPPGYPGFGGQPPNSGYGGQQPMPGYGGQPQNSGFGGQLPNAAYGGLPPNAMYGGQPTNQGGPPGYPQWGAPMYPQMPTQQGYPGGPPGYPQSSQGGQAYPNAGPGGFPNTPAPGPMGFSGPSAPPNTKESEAAQSAYYDPNQPQTAYVPPPAYYEPPPSYNSLNNKKQL